MNGKYVETEEYIDSVNPSNPSEIVGKIGLISLSQADEAMESAKKAFKTWSKTPAKQRADILRKAGDIMEAKRHELTAWMCYEVGKIVKEGEPEVTEAIDFCRYYADASIVQPKQKHLKRVIAEMGARMPLLSMKVRI